MIRFDHDAEPGQLLPATTRRITVMLAAFEGWNDAGDAASDALKVLDGLWGAEPLATLESDEYYDFQFTRPAVRREESGRRRIQWPTTRLTKASVGELDVIFVHGIEPSYRWRAFTEELLEHAVDLSVDCLVLVGALLADVPHSRPIPVTLSSEDAAIRARLDLEAPLYEGPTGILGVLSEAAEDAQLASLSLWAAVPHYVAQSPSPKAQLAIVHKLEELLRSPVNPGELVEDAQAWERGVDELATEDPEVAQYVRQLEEAKDTADLPEATGESIAREFERYLRRRGKDLP
ncbi:proteasome assembly chaperone family protein [Psychromicrobium xiongbiense]|uniref:proteasome assembly chaperone family protein n=1 Tax=Psychromicrobium xiongbiense TaxID=3051184 RepID=UPI00255437E0|nr:PAC2 family protein [Psychromicrobium sp. YIM S02556]